MSRVHVLTPQHQSPVLLSISGCTAQIAAGTNAVAVVCGSGQLHSFSFPDITPDGDGLIRRCVESHRAVEAAPPPLVLLAGSRNLVAFTSKSADGDGVDTVHVFGMNIVEDAATKSLQEGGPAPEPILPRLRLQVLGMLLRVTQLAVGDSHMLVLTADGHVHSTGTCAHGELGLGVAVPFVGALERLSCVFDGATPVAVAAGSVYSAVIARESSAGSPGSSRGDNDDDDADVDDGSTHHLYTFGCGAYHRLGHGSDEDCVSPRRVAGALDDAGALRPDGRTSGVAAVACGRVHTVAVARHTHAVYAWGWNKFHQCGRGVGACCAAGGSEVWSEPRRVDELDAPALVGDGRVEAVTCGSRLTALLVRGPGGPGGPGGRSQRVVAMGPLGLPSPTQQKEPETAARVVHESGEGDVVAMGNTLWSLALLLR